MPRQGDGSSNNGPFDMSHNIVHGMGQDDMHHTKKTAELPEGLHEKGAGLAHDTAKHKEVTEEAAEGKRKPITGDSKVETETT